MNEEVTPEGVNDPAPYFDEVHDGDHSWGRIPGPLPGMKINFGFRPDFFSPLNDAVWIPGAAATHMLADDFVVAISVEGVHYTIPWWVLKNHHVANLHLGSQFVMIAFCENCSSGAAFDPHIDGRLHSFQLGGTYQGTILLEDLETRTYWAPFTGEALHGNHLGDQLTAIPLYQCDWSEWLALHPDAVVTLGEGEQRDGHGVGRTPGSLEKRMTRSVERDKRLKPNVLVVGATVNGQSRAYPLDELDGENQALNDILGGKPIVVFSWEGTVLGIAFSRVLDGRVLTFEVAGPGVYCDLETESMWDIEGNCVAGPLAGRRLDFVPSLLEEWYAYAAARQSVEIFGGKKKVRAQPYLKQREHDQPGDSFG